MGVENDIFWSEIGSGFGGIGKPPGVISNWNPCCDHHIYAVLNLFCCDKRYEVFYYRIRFLSWYRRCLLWSLFVEFRPLLPYITCDALLGGVRKCMRIKFWGCTEIKPLTTYTSVYLSLYSFLSSLVSYHMFENESHGIYRPSSRFLLSIILPEWFRYIFPDSIIMQANMECRKTLCFD